MKRRDPSSSQYQGRCLIQAENGCKSENIGLLNIYKYQIPKNAKGKDEE
jgi:hypothetical protein